MAELGQAFGSLFADTVPGASGQGSRLSAQTLCAVTLRIPHPQAGHNAFPLLSMPRAARYSKRQASI
jgi:hypothetical protein